MRIEERQYRKLEREVTRLLKSLKGDIADEFRASDDPEDNIPGMQVTIGVTANEDGTLSWHYQTGDNSYTGGAYGHANWGVGSLYRRSNCRDLAHEMVEEVAESIEAAKESGVRE